MKILVLNSGGSSVKFKFIDMPDEKVIASGGIERVGKQDAVIKYKKGSMDVKRKMLPVKGHGEAIKLILGSLIDPKDGVVSDIKEIEAVGHRIVHAGEKIRNSVLIDDDVISIIEEYSDMAPLHNPPNLIGIRYCRLLMGDVPQVAVFDTALHKDLPDYVYIYGLPYKYYEKYGVRKYGFHGITFTYMTDVAAKLIKRPLRELKIVSLMLGSGCTANAMKYGKSIDISTGFTPFEGLIQSTRAGDTDATAITYIMDKEKLSPKQMENILNKESGWLGISGISNDLREIMKNADTYYRAKLAIKATAYRAKKYVGAYAAALGGMDILVFSGGIGENDCLMRSEICRGLNFLGIEMDEEKNNKLNGEGIISKENSLVKVVVVNTDEEIVIARDTYNVLNGKEK
ncbi:MAG TPA: acetate kinase [Clostridiaceae bacterium]|nr:acetate kinase [Clostridiaceae bacterium]